jgi:hypothetical protein
MSFAYSNRIAAGAQIILDISGASNARGNNAETGDPALYTDADQPGGYVMPVGATLYEDNTTPLATYPTSHFGPEVGYIQELVDNGIDPTRIVVVKHGVAGSALTTWNSTYQGEIEALFATTGYPNTALFWEGAAEAAASEAVALAWAANFLITGGLKRRHRGAGLPITLVYLNGQLSLGTYPQRDIVRAQMLAYLATAQGVILMNIDDEPISTPFEHFPAAAQISIGRRKAQQDLEYLIAA